MNIAVGQREETMGKLIDGDKLISTLVWGHYKIGKELQTVQKAIDDMRGEDAVPVIRCRECSYLHGVYIGDSYEWICMKLHRQAQEHNYCCWAERKEE